jgi:predicted TIM-barrel fold metal-dependent hydrolase
MNSSQGRGRVLFASDVPFLPMARAVEAARALPLDDASMDAFLAGGARRVLERA